MDLDRSPLKEVSRMHYNISRAKMTDQLVKEVRGGIQGRTQVDLCLKSAPYDNDQSWRFRLGLSSVSEYV